MTLEVNAPATAIRIIVLVHAIPKSHAPSMTNLKISEFGSCVREAGYALLKTKNLRTYYLPLFVA